ncbi:unnamed protein product [Rotaria magnacalcarata]|uniref:Neurexin/syndecan/glycophorin C domain-containing protein n=1 Tax=Rotaria magnacalcarata TaxID=392030 RepID=A0A816P8G1_9BILA|nr:unnamed protein product [Rotaria magnacalcarata]CAF4338323.1 unnamed protein product [Rotaria magnacalcarata]
MIIIYLIIFIIAIDGITTENHSTSHVILASSCQTTNSEPERISIESGHQYYFHIFDWSFLSSFVPLLPLSFCKHQRTTYHSSSGFDIFRSSPRFLLTGIVTSEQTSVFHQKNAVPFFIDQPISRSIVKLMSPNENNRLTDSDSNQLTTATTTTATTTVNSLLSTTTTTITTTTTAAISDVSLLKASLSTTQQGTNRTFNITLLIGCISASIILIIIIICAFVKYRNRDEGSYKIDESKNFVLTPRIDKHDKSGSHGKASSSQQHRQKLISSNEQNGVDSREWYV